MQFSCVRKTGYLVEENMHHRKSAWLLVCEGDLKFGKDYCIRQPNDEETINAVRIIEE